MELFSDFWSQQSSFCRLSTPPSNLEDLSDSLTLLETLQADIPIIEAQFEPLHDQFNILRKYEVQIPEEVELQLDRLQGNWMAFQQCLIDSDAMLKKHKVWLSCRIKLMNLWLLVVPGAHYVCIILKKTMKITYDKVEIWSDSKVDFARLQCKDCQCPSNKGNLIRVISSTWSENVQ